MKKFVAMLLALVMTLSLAACGQKNDTNDTKDDANSDTKELTYAVEAGSAGEAAAAEKGFKTVSVDTQAKALMEVDAGTADAAIIDLLMAGAMVGENTSYPNLKVTDQKLTSELYGIGCRKGSDLASFINSVLAETYASGKMQEIAATYGVQESLVEQSPCEYTASESDSDVQYIKDKGKLIVGITEFEPMDYQDANGQWIGFDADMAKLVAEKLGVEVEFQVINWDTKVEELDGKTILSAIEKVSLSDELLEKMRREHEIEEAEHAHEHHHHHDEHDEHDHDHEHHHDHDEDDDHDEHDHDDHEHHHHHHDGEECDDPECECHHHHHHHADDVFSSWGKETPKKFSKEALEDMLHKLDSGDYGHILRAKGIVNGEDGWLEFDYVPEEHEVRAGHPDYTGRLCVIGAELKEDGLAELFGV